MLIVVAPSSIAIWHTSAVNSMSARVASMGENSTSCMYCRACATVAQRRVEDQYSAGVLGLAHVTPRCLELGFFSVLVSRLRAAAHALFPPRGEEKKSEREAERHAGLSLAIPVLRHDLRGAEAVLDRQPGGRWRSTGPRAATGAGGAAGARARAALRVHEE